LHQTVATQGRRSRTLTRPSFIVSERELAKAHRDEGHLEQQIKGVVVVQLGRRSSHPGSSPTVWIVEAIREGRFSAVFGATG
jgi:hypothetical protein